MEPGRGQDETKSFTGRFGGHPRNNYGVGSCSNLKTTFRGSKGSLSACDIFQATLYTLGFYVF